MGLAHHHGGASRSRGGGGCWPEGSAIGIMAPVVAPRKRPFAGEKVWGVSDSLPLGAELGSSASATLTVEIREVLPQRGHGLRRPSGVGLPGSKMAMMAPSPSPRSLEQAVMQGKSRGAVIHVLCGPGWTRLPTLAQRSRKPGASRAATPDGEGRALPQSLELGVAQLDL
jgi:hypothetical protein